MKKLIQLIKEDGLFSRVTGHLTEEIWDYNFLAVYQEDEEWHIAPAFVESTQIHLVNNVDNTFAITSNLYRLTKYVRGEMKRNEDTSLDEAIGLILRLTNARFTHKELKDKFFEIEAREAKYMKGGAK